MFSLVHTYYFANCRLKPVQTLNRKPFFRSDRFIGYLQNNIIYSCINSTEISSTIYVLSCNISMLNDFYLILIYIYNWTQIHSCVTLKYLQIYFLCKTIRLSFGFHGFRGKWLWFEHIYAYLNSGCIQQFWKLFKSLNIFLNIFHHETSCSCSEYCSKHVEELY